MPEKKNSPYKNTGIQSDFGITRRSTSVYPPTNKSPQNIPSETILNSITDGIFTIDRSWRITSFNRAAEEITGIANQNALGHRCSKIFCSLLCGKNCPMEKTFATKIPIINIYTEIITPQGFHIPVYVSTSLLRDQHNEVIGGTETFQDLRLGVKLSSINKSNPAETDKFNSLSMQVAKQATEVQTIIAALRKNNFNRQAAANDLGIHKSTFFRKIKSLGIILPQIDGRFRLSNQENGQ